MTKRLWMFMTFAGAVIFVAGLILTIVLINETGEVVDDSQCDSTLGPPATAQILQASCVTSDDPKVLLGILPLFVGGAMAGIGVWRWIATATAGGDDGDGGGGGGLMGSLKNLQAQAEALQQQAMQSTGTMSAGTPPAAPPPTSPPTPPAPPTPDAT